MSSPTLPPTLTIPPILQPEILRLPDTVPSVRCSGCCTELCAQSELVSRAFSGSGGPAWLVRNVLNVSVGPGADKVLLTGKHKIGSLYCLGCHTELGWTYFSTPSEQSYKKGKNILEKSKIYKDNKWD